VPALLQPGSILAWALIGILAGAISGRIVRGRGMGCLADLVVGVLGAFIGGTLLSLIMPRPATYGFVGSLLVAVLGATLLLALVRALSGGRR